MVVEKMLLCFQKGEIIDLHQAKKKTKEIAKLTGIWLRTVQRIIKTWKDSGELSTLWKKCGRKKTNDRHRRSLKCLVKWICKKNKNNK